MFLALALLIPCLIAIGVRSRTLTAGGAWLRSRYTPAIVGAAWAAFVWFSWGSLHPMPLDHDEVAYLLQAGLFAQGRWAALPPPLPDFFGQAHVLVTPVLASKYPPGHSLLLALGALVGMPVLIVFLLNALRVGLFFALARRVSDPVTALVAVALLYTGDSQVRFSASYYSETSSGALLMLAWYCLWRWRDHRRRAWLFAVALALGWTAITRPWSAVAFALPIGFVVLRDCSRLRLWRELASALAVGACVVVILPLWSWGTMGDWRRMPLAEYARDYMPFDFPHFGVVNVRPRLTPPPDVATINVSLLEAERSHTLGNLGPDIVARGRAFWRSVFPVYSAAFLLLALIGLVVLPAAAWLAVATAAAVFAAYLAHPTWPDWTVYYFEVTPVFIFAGALGFTAVLRLLAGELRGREMRFQSPRAARAGVACCVLMIPVTLMNGGSARRWLRAEIAPRRRFEFQIAHLPHTPAIVFVRYGPRHSPHRSLVVNRADWPTAPVWVVYDRGPENAALRALAPERKAYLYDQASERFMEMP